MLQNELMDLKKRYAKTPLQREAIQQLLTISGERCKAISKLIEARVARSDPRVGRDRNDGRDGGRSAGRLPR
jgi:hypothetical protein